SLSLIGATKDTSPGQGAEVLADPKRDFLPKVRPVRLKHREPREIRQLLAQVNHGCAGADVPHGELTVQRPAAHDANAATRPVANAVDVVLGSLTKPALATPGPSRNNPNETRLNTTRRDH